MLPRNWLSQLEEVRRERSTASLKTEMVDAVDYGSSGIKIDLARTHLDEGIPNKQKARVETAYAALKEGTAELGLWLKENGYDVD